MHKSIKLTLNALLLLTLSACASTGHKKQATKNINSPPAIDVPYQEVSNNIKDNVGVNVRWGGEIISAKKAGEATELTVVALPLSKRGRPLPQSGKQNHNERFIVKVTDYEDSILRKYLTVYGQVTGAETLVNDPKTKIIPVVTAINSKQWKSLLSSNRRGYAFYDLGIEALTASEKIFMATDLIKVVGGRRFLLKK